MADVNLTRQQTAARIMAIGNPANLPAADADIIAAISRLSQDNDLDEINRRILAAFPTDTASGLIASFSDGADGVPVKSLVAQITPVQEGSGDPSPTNIRPIMGRTGAQITRIGKNWIQYGSSDYTESGVTFTRTVNGTVVCNGTSTALIVYTFAWNIDPKGQSFILSGCPAGGGVDTYRLDARTDAGTGISGSFDYGSGSSAFTPSGSSFRVCIRIASGVAVNNLIFLPMLRLASIADATYAPYDGTTYTVTWQNEVFAGTATYMGGGEWSIQATHVAIPSLSTLEWGYTTNGGFFNVGVGYLHLDGANRDTLICNKYKTLTPAATVPDDNCIGITLGGDNLRIRDSRYTDPATFKATLSDAVCYAPLLEAYYPAPVVVYGPDPATLLGDNNMWADSGDVSVTYRADTGLYIQKKIAEVTA